jgi:hypothetical protein
MTKHAIILPTPELLGSMSTIAAGVSEALLAEVVVLVRSFVGGSTNVKQLHGHIKALAAQLESLSLSRLKRLLSEKKRAQEPAPTSSDAIDAHAPPSSRDARDSVDATDAHEPPSSRDACASVDATDAPEPRPSGDARIADEATDAPDPSSGARVSVDAGDSPGVKDENAPVAMRSSALVSKTNDFSDAIVSDALELVTKADLGRCYIAAREIEQGELLIKERPVVDTGHAASNDGTSDDSEALRAARAFAKANASQRAFVLSTLDTIPLEEHGGATVAQAEAIARSLSSQHAWAKPWAHDPRPLRDAILAFRLNSHAFGPNGRAALFRHGSKFAHACDANTRYSSDEHPGFGCHYTTRHVTKGSLVTADYLGYSIGDHLTRQLLLLETKLFLCRCARCTGPDRTACVPCPGCHPRSADGMLPEETRASPLQAGAAPVVHYVMPLTVGAEAAMTANEERPSSAYHCAACSRTYTAEAVFPLEAIIDGNEDGLPCALGRRLERQACALAMKLEPADAADAASLDPAVVEAYVSAAKSAVGMRHWATAKVLDLQNRRLVSMCQSEDLSSTDTTSALATLDENSEWLWRFCCETRTPPEAFEWSANIAGRRCIKVPHAASSRARLLPSDPRPQRRRQDEEAIRQRRRSSEHQERD